MSGPFYSPRNHQTDYHNHYLLDYSHLAHYYTPEDIGADAGCSSNTPACQNVVVLGSRCLLRTMARTMPMVFRAMLVGNDSKLNIKLTRGFVVFIFDEQVEIGSDQHWVTATDQFSPTSLLWSSRVLCWSRRPFNDNRYGWLVHHRQHRSLVDHNLNSNSETDVSLLSSSASLSDACRGNNNNRYCWQYNIQEWIRKWTMATTPIHR